MFHFLKEVIASFASSWIRPCIDWIFSIGVLYYTKFFNTLPEAFMVHLTINCKAIIKMGRHLHHEDL